MLCAGERRLLTSAMLAFRNKLLAGGKPTVDVNELLLLKRGRRSFCALSREIPLICEFSENFQKSMSFFDLRGCGKRVRGIRSIFEVDVENFPLDVAVRE